MRRGEKRKVRREKRREKRGVRREKEEGNIRINSRLVYTPTCTSMKLY